MLFSPQIPLPLEPRRVGQLEDFVSGPNGAALEAVRTAVAEADTLLFLSGPAGSGKTHLLNAACVATRARGASAFYLDLGQLPADGSAVLEGLEAMELVGLDNLHAVAGQAAWEERLFHLFNAVRARHGRLLITSREPLGALPLVLPDLASRLAWGLRADLQPLTDADKAEVMRRLATSLGVDLPEEVSDYLLRYGNRNLARLLSAVERLQHASFVAQRRITVPLAREVLKLRD